MIGIIKKWKIVFISGLLALFMVFFYYRTHLKKSMPRLALYHWKMKEDYDQQNDLKVFLPVQKIFFKVMDIDWNDIYGAYPTATIQYDSTFLYSTDTLPVIPTVFITNKAIDKTDSANIQTLAKKILLKTEKLNSRYINNRDDYYGNKLPFSKDTPIRFKNLQIDCDWTKATKNKYFLLLTSLKKLYPSLHLSATLRLHQYKYQKETGIPPVDEVYLMCYNTGDLKNIHETNSIFEESVAKTYFHDVRAYPLPLSFALPFFSWSVIFRNGRFYGLDSQIPDALFSNKMYFKPLEGNAYQMERDTVLNGRFLREGDYIRHETITEEALLKAAKLCSEASNQESFDVVFFDIDHIDTSNEKSIHKAFETFSH